MLHVTAIIWPAIILMSYLIFACKDMINRNVWFNMTAGTLIKCFLRFHYLAKAVILKCINPQRYLHTFSISYCQNPSKRQSKSYLTTGWHSCKHRKSLYFYTVFMKYCFFTSVTQVHQVRASPMVLCSL